MAETVYLDLVTPEGSPEPAPRPQEPVLPVAPEEEGEPVVQVAEGGPGRAGKSLLVGIRLIQAGDWSPPEDDVAPKQLPSFQNVRYWTTQALGDQVEGSQVKVVDASKFSLSVWRPEDGVKPIKTLFPKIACDTKILAVFAHSAPYHRDDSSIGKNDPRQYLSLGDGDQFYVPLKGVADVLNDQTSKIRDKYDLVFLGCCQGDKLAGLIRKAVRRQGLIVYFGADEEERDGAAGGLISEFWEGFLEHFKERVSVGEQPDWKDIFEKAYVEVGGAYLAPKGEEGRRVVGSDDFEFMECILDKSVKTAMKDKAFVEHYTFAGDLHAVMDGVDLVTDELKARRAAFLAARQLEVDREHRGGKKAGSPVANKGKRSRV